MLAFVGSVLLLIIILEGLPDDMPVVAVIGVTGLIPAGLSLIQGRVFVLVNAPRKVGFLLLMAAAIVSGISHRKFGNC